MTLRSLKVGLSVALALQHGIMMDEYTAEGQPLGIGGRMPLMSFSFHICNQSILHPA
jgi:hypothetical protein